MMFRTKLATIAGALVLMGSSFAGQELCPSIDLIKTEGVFAADSMFGLYMTSTISNYNTESTWMFAMGPIYADSAEIAIQVSNDILSSMITPGVPQEDPVTTVCTYDTGNPNLKAIALRKFDFTKSIATGYLFSGSH